MGQLKQAIQGEISYLEVSHANYSWSTSAKTRTRDLNVQDELDRIIKEAAKGKEELESPLILDRLPVAINSGIKVFTRVVAHGEEIKPEVWKQINNILLEQMTEHENNSISRVSTYLGYLTRLASTPHSMNCILVKYDAKDFYSVDGIPYVFHDIETISSLKLRTNTYLVTKPPQAETDDGPFLLERIDRLQASTLKAR